MAVSDYSTVRDTNAGIVPGNIRVAADNLQAQQIVNSIRQLMADLAVASASWGGAGPFLEASDIGVTVQAWDADLDAIAALTTASYGRSLLTSTTAGGARTLLGVNGIISIMDFGATGDGTADDTAEVDAAFAYAVANGIELTGLGLTYGVTGKIVIPTGLRLSDATFKQLAPGASLSVITLEADTKQFVNLRRVKVDRNGDGTNGGLLGASGVNGALNTAFGMKFISCTDSHFEDLECWGDDSGCGILFRLLDSTCHIIRPYAHDIEFDRATATDDNVQGLWFDQLPAMEIEGPRSINLTAIVGGSASRRFTRAIGIGGCTGTRFTNSFVDHVDQGFDITGGPTPNLDLVVSLGVSSDCKTYGFKLANTARRCRVTFCTTYDCGVGYVASPNSAEASTVTTRDCYFINCVAFNTGSLGSPVVTAGGFRVMQSAATDSGRARDIWFINCLAVDEQGTATMEYGFMSEITAIGDAPWFINCTSIGHTTGARQGLWRTFPDAVGTVSESGGIHTGALMEYTTPGGDYKRKYADGIMEQWGVIDDTAGNWSTASGALFRRSAALTKTFDETFDNVPTVVVTASRGDTTICTGVNLEGYGASDIDLVPWTSVAVANGNAKYIHWHALGRWY